MGKNRTLRYLGHAYGNFMRFWQQKAPFCRGKAGYHFANTSLRGQFGKCELVGAQPLHFACAKTFCHSNTPQGCLLLRKRELVGVKLRHFACAKTFCRSNIPLGCLLLAQTGTCRGAAPPSCYRKTVLSLAHPTGVCIVELHSTNANLSGRSPSILLTQDRSVA